MKRMMTQAICLIALVTLFAPIARGQEIKIKLLSTPSEQLTLSSLPPRLPIADIEDVLAWNVTNSMYRGIYVELSWTNSVTHKQDGAYRRQNPINFADYAAFRLFVETNGMWIHDWISTNKDVKVSEIGSEVTLLVNVPFIPPYPNNNHLYNGFTYSANLGPFLGITKDTFKNMTPTYTSVNVVISVPGLERFEIQADTAPPESYYVYTNGVYVKLDNPPTPPYTYTWDHGAEMYSRNIRKFNTNIDPWYNEYTTTNLIVLNDWCFNATNRIRFTIVANGQTNMYTQHGDVLRPPLLVISKDSVNVTMSRGADIAIESSANLKDWTTLQTFFWHSGSENTSFFQTNTSPCQFFRARTW